MTWTIEKMMELINKLIFGHLATPVSLHFSSQQSRFLQNASKCSLKSPLFKELSIIQLCGL